MTNKQRSTLPNDLWQRGRLRGERSWAVATGPGRGPGEWSLGWIGGSVGRIGGPLASGRGSAQHRQEGEGGGALQSRVRRCPAPSHCVCVVWISGFVPRGSQKMGPMRGPRGSRRRSVESIDPGEAHGHCWALRGGVGHWTRLRGGSPWGGSGNGGGERGGGRPRPRTDERSDEWGWFSRVHEPLQRGQTPVIHFHCTSLCGI